MSKTKKIAKHLPHYLSLIGILVFGFLGFWFFSYDKTFQVAVVVAVAVSYTVWGVIHHAIHRDLHLDVVIEYMAISALGLLVMLSLIFRA